MNSTIFLSKFSDPNVVLYPLIVYVVFCLARGFGPNVCTPNHLISSQQRGGRQSAYGDTRFASAVPESVIASLPLRTRFTTNITPRHQPTQGPSLALPPAVVALLVASTPPVAALMPVCPAPQLTWC